MRARRWRWACRLAGVVATFGAVACEQSLDVLSPGPDGSARLDAGIVRDATDRSDVRVRTDGARVADAEPRDTGVTDAPGGDVVVAPVDAACIDVPTVQLQNCLACSPACANGNPCGHNHDCASARCTAGKCVPPMCSPRCGDMTPCGADADCASGLCSDERCHAPMCAPSCAAGTACGANVDCLSHHCMAGACM